MEDIKSFDKGRLCIVSGPAYTGKTTLIKSLMKKNPNVTYHKRYITREPRDGERDGVDNHFITEEEYDRMNFRFRFERTNCRVGIDEEQINKAFEEGESHFLQIAQDYPLIKRMKDYYGARVTTIFIYSSPEVLRQRMEEPSRQGESMNVKIKRLEEGIEQIRKFETDGEMNGLYDYAIKNDGSIEAGIAKLEEIMGSWD